MPETENIAAKHYLLAASIFGAGAVLLGAAALTGWAADFHLLSGDYNDKIPMAPNTAIEFILSGICLIAYARNPLSRPIAWLIRITLAVISVFSLLTIIQYLLDDDWGIDNLLFHTRQHIGQIPVGHASPLTALAFLAIAASFLIIQQKNLSATFAAAVLPLALIVTVGYLYDTPLLYGGTTVPMALPTAIAFFFLGCGLILAGQKDSWPIRLLAGESLRAQLMRVFLPLGIIVVLFEGWLIGIIIQQQSDLNPALLSSVTAIVILAGTSLVISWIARTVGGSVDRANGERAEAEQKLRDALQLLESIFEHTHLMLAYLDPQFDFIRVNRAYARADSREPSFYAGKNHFDLYPNEENQRIFEAVVTTGEPYFAIAKVFTYEEHPERGASYWDWSLVPIKDDLGNVTGLILSLLDVTERMQAEENLKLASAYNRSLIEVSLDPLVTIDASGKITDVNIATEKVTGHKRSELIGTDFSDYFTDPEKARDGYQQVFREGMVKDYALEISHRKGQITPVVYNASVYRDEAGKVVGVFAAARDISERLRAEEAMRRSNRALKVLSDCNQVLVRAGDESSLLNEACRIMVETGGYYCAWIGFCEENNVLGMEPVAHAGCDSVLLESLRLTWAEAEDCRDHARDVLIERHPIVCRNSNEIKELSPRLADNLDQGCESMAVLPLVVGDETIGSMHVYSDDTDAFGTEEMVLLTELVSDIAFGVKSLRVRKEKEVSEKALIESETKYRVLFEESKDAIFMITPNGKIMDINPAGIELFGDITREEMSAIDLGRDLKLKPSDMKKMIKAIEEQGFVKDTEVHLRRHEGGDLNVLVSATSISDDRGQVRFYSGIIHDVTEYRRLEEQLYRAQRLESVGRLAGGIAHDFNNFLTAIRGYVDLARRELPPRSEAGEDLVEAGKAAERASNLTRQLLIFSRRESMDLKPVDLNVIVGELLKMLDKLIGERYKIVTELDESLARVNGDTGHIEQVIMNLVVNARDAMPEGGEIYISTKNVFIKEEHASRQNTKPGEHINLSVRDRGFGMDEETQSHIFEPFFSKKPGIESTGLGLSLVYGIIQQHSGWVEVKSAPGQGSTFSIYLPAISSVARAPLAFESVAGAGGGHGERILLVEDEDQVRRFATKVLKRNGYQVLDAGSAEDALGLCKRENCRFDLVFSDVVLPGEDGIWLAEKLFEQIPEVPILLASGYHESPEQDAIREKGFRFISKPYSGDLLLSSISEMIKKD